MISLCLCTYNGELFLRNQLDSILDGTKLPDEIVVFDDCSTDQSANIILEYQKKFSSILWTVVIRKSNVGWRVNFHDAINMAKGDIIFLSDQDDIWQKDKIQVMTDAINSNPNILLLSCNYEITYDRKKTKKNASAETHKIEFIDSNSKQGFIGINPGCTYCFKRTLIGSFNEIWSSELAHDRVLWTCAFLRGGLAILDYYGINWCRHETSASLIDNSFFSKSRYKYKLHEVRMNRLTSQYMLKYLVQHKCNNKIIFKFYQCSMLREDYYKKPTLMKFIRLFKFVKSYPSFKSYLLDIIAIFNKEKRL